MAHGEGGEAWLPPGLSAHGSAPGWELTAGAKSREVLRRDCQEPGGSQSSARNRWQDVPEHAQGHKSSSSGPRTSPRLCRARRGLFRGERLGYLLAGPGSVSRSRGWPGLHRIPGLSRPPEQRRAPDSCGSLGWTGSQQADFPPLPTCRGPGARPGRLGGPSAAVCAQDKTQRTKAASGTLSTTPAAAGRARGAGEGAPRPLSPGTEPRGSGFRLVLHPQTQTHRAPSVLKLSWSRSTVSEGAASKTDLFTACPAGERALSWLQIARRASVSPQSPLTIPLEQLSCSIDPSSLWNSLPDP